MADGDIQYCKDILQPCLYSYPKGVIFLFYAGRIEEITGNMDGVSMGEGVKYFYCNFHAGRSTDEITENRIWMGVGGRGEVEST